MIELHIMLRTLRSQTRPVLAAFKFLSRRAEAESGCLSVQLSVTVDDPRCICYCELWADEDDVLKMIRSEHFSQLAALMELAAEKPLCEFRFIGESRGLEFPVEVRSCEDGKPTIAT